MPSPETPLEQVAQTDATSLWNVMLGNVALRYLRSETRWMKFHYQSRIERQGSDGSWEKIGLLDSKIHIDSSGYWPKEELTRIFFEDRCVAGIETQAENRTLIIDGVGSWRFDEAVGNRLIGLESDLPAI